jgi:hypothetical protein
VPRFGKNPERSQITDDLEERDQQISEKHEELEIPASDVELENETLRDLEGGTLEGLSAAQQEIRNAQGVSAGEFDERGSELEQIRSEGQDFEGEMQQQADATLADRGKVADAATRIHSDAASGELKEAEQALDEDKQFLEEQEKCSAQAREESQRLQEEMKQRVDNARSE